MAPDPLKYFRIEARDILDQLSRGALDLEKGTARPEVVAQLLRSAHTLKGAARVVKQAGIAEAAHELEDALARVRDTDDLQRGAELDRVLVLIDTIGQHVAELAGAPAAPQPVVEQSDLPAPSFRPAMEDLDTLLSGLVAAYVQVNALRPRFSRIGDAMRVSTPDDAGARLGEIERDLNARVDQLDRELRQVRETAERMRLVPVNSMFTFLERAVRDVARSLHKRVTFYAVGGDVRVDPVVLNTLQGALLHVVRNAAGHGIEASDAERRAAGKPAGGTVELRVTQHGRLVSFACRDDGKGVDLEAVRRIAQHKGIASAHDAATSVESLLQMLLEGGISTSTAVTDVAGRGIGLDVVREAAERLGGSVAIRTERGQGTTIEIIIPLSIASFPVLNVDVAGEQVAIPLDAVRGTLRVGPDDVVRGGDRQMVVYVGEALPLAPLHRILVPGTGRSHLDARMSAVVVEGRSGLAALTVDRLLGVTEVVMRPLPTLAQAAPVAAGATLDAIGDPRLVLDPHHLAAMAQQYEDVEMDPPASRLPILVIDDSLTTRMLEQSILESAGYDVDVASSAEEGLDKARAGRFGLFLVDVEMPGMDGFSFVEHARADPQLGRTPAILVTSRNAPEDLRRGRDVGAAGYMVKSEFDQATLLAKIKTLVG